MNKESWKENILNYCLFFWKKIMSYHNRHLGIYRDKQENMRKLEVKVWPSIDVLKINGVCVFIKFVCVCEEVMVFYKGTC